MRRLAVVLGSLTISASALGQPGPSRRPFPVQPQTPTATATAQATSPSEVTTDLRARFGADVAARLLRSADADERLRGIARAAATESPEGMALLVQAADSTGVARGDARAMIAVARGLSFFADQSAARAALVSLVNAVPSSPSVRSRPAPNEPPVDEAEHAARLQLARQTAALALASAGDAKSIEALVTIARTGGVGQSCAVSALSAFPLAQPNSLALGTLMTPASIRLVAELGDLRALEGIRAAAKSSDLPTRATAITALGEMGDGRGVEIARAAMNEKDARVRVAGGQALVLLDAPERFQAVEALIVDDVTAASGVLLAQRTSNDKIARALAARAVASADPELRGNSIVALGRSSSADALQALQALMQDARLEGDAAHALGRSPNPAAMNVLEKAIGSNDPAKRRLALRAYVMRALTRGEKSDVALAAIEHAAASKDSRDQELAVFALVVLGKRSLESALDEHDPKARRAAAMASLEGDNAKRSSLLLARLAKEPDAITRQVLGIGLLEGDPERELTTLMLVDRSEAGEADAPLAAMALATRTSTVQDPKVNALLASRDLVVRAHAARGLGKSSAPDAVGRLAAAYAYEFEPAVRRAILHALAEHTGSDAMSPARQGTLKLASRLDPDRMVRWIAARALLNAPAPITTEPREMSWIRITPPEGGGALPSNVVGTLVRSDGMAVPIAFDDDGYALVPGVPPGDARLYLAPRVTAYEAGKR